MRSVLIIATIAIIAAAAAGVVTASPEQGCCFAQGTPFSYVLNTTSYSDVSGVNMPLFTTEYAQTDPIANKTYVESRSFHQDGTWSSLQQWYWYDNSQGQWMLADKRSDWSPSCKVSTAGSSGPTWQMDLCINTQFSNKYMGTVGVGSQQMYRYGYTVTFPAVVTVTTIVDASNCAPVSTVSNSPYPISSETGTYTDVRPAVNADLFKLPSDCRRAAIMSTLKGDAATNMVAAAIEARRGRRTAV